ncbi:autotransporter domain-containing protein [Devosia sp. Root685]|uniref:autotransporter domain-containing protein n=1 Tax=Devosia sp. Root685 TaxID=1736587 RepID=UPI000A3DE484|nr:autotransporter domain-containing protein [Devosia sp. Root685]
MARMVFGARTRRRFGGRTLGLGLLLGTTALVLAPRVEAAGEVALPTHPDFGPVWRIPALSADGTIWAGDVDTDGKIIVYRPEGYIDMGGLGGGASHVYGMNGAGTVVVGASRGENNDYRAFRWTEAGGIQSLGLLFPGVSGARSYAHDVSGDGTRVVGLHTQLGMSRGFVWVEGATGGEAGNPQMYRLEGLDDAGRWSAAAISDDGRYAAGYSDGNATLGLATRWDLTQIGVDGTNSVLNLGALTGMDGGNSSASDISADGRVVVGMSGGSTGFNKAFRWVEGSTGGAVDNVQMHELGALGDDPFNQSGANAVSRDGQYVVGWSEANLPHRLAFRWSEETGMESVQGWLERHGVAVGGLALADATAISDNGLVIAGIMVDDEDVERAYIARVAQEPGPGPNPGTGIMDVAEYNATLYGAAGIANAGEFLTWLPMNGAHHRPLMLTPNLSGDMCAWATGDFAHYGQSGANLALAEAGACVDLAGGAVRLGGSVGTTASWQALSLGGAANMVGQYVLGEMDWQPDGTPLLLSVTGMLGGWQAKVDRAYSNGAATAVSNGQTNAMGGVVRVRADWLEAAAIGNTSFNPWASVAFGALYVDGYSESGGPFPARFAAQNIGHTDIRVGLTAITEFSKETKLSTTLELAHRTGTAASAVGQVDGLFSFSLGGGTYGQTWGRLGLELDHRINDAVALSTSLHLATNGRDPTVAVSAGIKGAF